MLLASPLFSQPSIDPLDWYKGVSKDSIKRYRIFFFDGDSTHVDTTLTIENYFKHNLLRKDNLLLQRFANQGENYNWLSYQETSHEIPRMGFRTKRFNYLEKEDVKYYDVATPITELALKTGYRGQFLDAVFAVNIKPNLNFSIGYKGDRSVGKYQESLTSQSNMHATINFVDSTNRYNLKAHFINKNINNQESGGIENDLLFLSNDVDYQKRTTFAMNLSDAESLLKGKNIFIKQSFNFPFEIDTSLSTKAFVEHVGEAKTEFFQYTDNTKNNLYFFGSDVFDNAKTMDSTNYKYIQNDIFIGVNENNTKSFAKVGLGYNYQSYGYDSIKVISDNNIVAPSIKGGTMSIKAAGKLYLDSILKIESHASYNFAGKYAGAFEFLTNADVDIKNNKLGASLGLYSFFPEMQFWLYQSNYISYNYFNKLDLQHKLDFKIYFESKTWFDTYLRYVNHKNYTFFDADNYNINIPDGKTMPINAVSPVKTVQLREDLNIVELGIHKKINFWVLGFDSNTIFQKVLTGESAFRVPEIVTRNNFYYKGEWFRHALIVQTGIEMKYISAFSSFQYNPLNGMYFRPKNDINIGNYTTFNAFFNARVRTARIYFVIENISNFLRLGKTNYFSAPHYPGTDTAIRFGVVWNFFT